MEKREIEGKAFKNIIQYSLKAVLDLLIPRKCVVCDSTLESDEKHICSDCIEDLPRTYYWLRKFNPMADRFNALIQEGMDIRITQQEQQSEAIIEQDGQASTIHMDYAFAAALFFYRAESGYRRIPYQIKYHGDIPAGRFFGQMLGEKIASAEHFADVDAVIPVPLHWTRKWSRGYNQAEIIAREVATVLGAELRADILERCRRTRTQTRLTIEGKAANVQDAFRVRPCIIDSFRRSDSNSGSSHSSDIISDPASLKHLLLIDDVFTTGSTLHACFEALRAVFPACVRISVATLAFVGEA